ncbi:MAG: SOS response-associated peptidase [Arenicellales bacterium]
MCGRYNVTPNSEAFLEVFEIMEGLDTLPDKPRYNIAPSGDAVPAVRQGATGRQLCMLRWPLIPHWAKEGKVKFATANAKGETLAEKPAFRNAWQRGRRCLIPANGYYEWQKAGDRKQPYHIQMADGGLFAFGGLWDRCRTGAGDVIESCTIITTAPTASLAHLHSRMPLIIPRRAYSQWLTGDAPKTCIKPFDETELAFYPVSTFVNNPRNDDPRCIERV